MSAGMASAATTDVVRVCGDLRGDDHVGRQHDPSAGVGEQARGRSSIMVLFEQRAADDRALRGKEGEAHAAADRAAGRPSAAAPR